MIGHGITTTHKHMACTSVSLRPWNVNTAWLLKRRAIGGFLRGDSELIRLLMIDTLIQPDYNILDSVFE